MVHCETKESLETYLQILEIANDIAIGERDYAKRLNFPLVLLKSEMFAMEVGSFKGWGNFLNIPEKRDRYGLGYKPPMRKKEVMALNTKTFLFIAFNKPFAKRGVFMMIKWPMSHMTRR